MSTPFFPGYDFRSVAGKQQRHKDQHMSVISGLMKTRTPDPSILDVQIEETRKKLEALEQQDLQATTVHSFTPDFNPPVSQVSLVLRFFAYFQQSITESPEETYRVRYVRIYVYVEDETIMIEEHRERNSGMDQGVLLRRMQVENPNAQRFGTYYCIEDFNIGNDMDISGVVYHIYDCDKFTRNFLEQNGTQVPPKEGTPDDLYTIKRKLTERPIRVSNINTDKTNLANFLKYDGKVLRFYATWDDTDKLFGEKRKFVIIYFLVDGSIEIRQVLEVNSGRDPYHAFLSKTMIRKPDRSGFYTDADLYIGATLNAFNRLFVIYDADKFTRDWLDQKYGPHDWTPIPQEDQYFTQTTVQEPPPYNGWGDETDSLGYCYSLHPQPPKKNIVKLLEKEGHVIRFKAEFADPAPVDKGRIFVVCFYQADDNVAVFEMARRNSGFRDGKFIQKGLYKNPETGRLFQANEFAVGNVITINAYRFVLTDADEYAFNLMEAEADEFPQSDLSGIVDYIRRNKESIQTLREEFESLDPELTGLILKDDATKKIVRVLRLQLHEALTIVRRWTEGNNFNYFQFFSVLQ